MFGCQEGETDFAGCEADVGVGDACFEADGGWGEGVVGRDFDVDLPEAAFIPSQLTFVRPWVKGLVTFVWRPIDAL